MEMKVGIDLDLLPVLKAFILPSRLARSLVAFCRLLALV